MSTKEKELIERFDAIRAVVPPPRVAAVLPMPVHARTTYRSAGSAELCSTMLASEMVRKHTVTEFGSLTVTEPKQTHVDLTWGQLILTIAPFEGCSSPDKISIPLYIAGALKVAPWVGKTRELKDAARAHDSTVPTEGLQRSNTHIASLDAAVGDVDDKPDEGKRCSVWDVSKRLEQLGVGHVAYKSWSGVSGVSESGRVIAAIDRSILPDEYPDFFRAWQDVCGHQLDPAGRARSQAYFKFAVPIDAPPDAASTWRREFDGHVLSVDKMVARGRVLDVKSAKKLAPQFTVTGSDAELWKARLALAVLPADDYKIWQTIGAALRREFGGRGFELWRTWSHTSSKCEADKLEEKWNTFEPDHDGPARIATLHYYASEAAKSVLEARIDAPADRARVASALAYLLAVHPKDPVHDLLRDGKGVSADLERQARRILAWQTVMVDVHPRVPILYGPGNVQQAMREVAAALAPHHRLFVRDGHLVRLVRAGELLGSVHRAWHAGLSVDAPMFAVVQKIQEVMVEADPWVTIVTETETNERAVWAPSPQVRLQRFRSKHVPGDLCQSILQYGSELGFLKMEGVIEHPTLRADGSILEAQGYDRDSGWLCELNSVYPGVPKAPSRDDALQALARISDLYAEFPFSDPDHPGRPTHLTSSYAAALAALFTRALPIVLDSRKPIFALNGPAAGSGKTTLDAIPALVFSGREPVTHVLALDPKESKKEILALLLEGHLDITLDNVNGLLDSAELSSLTTADEFSGRILGSSRTVRVKPRANWHVNGNGLALKGDLRSRAVWHELDPRLARPDERLFRRDLRAYIRSCRAQIVVDVLTILLAYRRAERDGKVPSEVLNAPPRSRFSRWESFVRKPLLWLGLADPLGNRDAAFATDLDEEHVGGFLRVVEEVQASSARARARWLAQATVKALEQAGNVALANHLFSQIGGPASASQMMTAIRSTVLSAQLDQAAAKSVSAAIAAANRNSWGGLGDKFTATDLVTAATGADGQDLATALAGLGVDVRDVTVHRALGYKIRPLVGRIVGDRRIVRAGRSAGTGKGGGAALWRIEVVVAGQGS